MMRYGYGAHMIHDKKSPAFAGLSIVAEWILWRNYNLNQIS